MKASVRIDHFICGATQNLKDLLAAYQEIGFAVCTWEQTVRHDPGLRTGFLHFSPKPTLDYIEFLTVENPEVFAAAQARGEDQWTDKIYAQGVGVRTTDANAVHRALTAQGAAVEPVKSKKPEGAAEDTPYVWSFIELKEPASGLGAFYVQYHRSRPPAEPEIVDGGNGIYALGGVLYDGKDTGAVASALAKDFPEGTVEVKGKDISLGCHTVAVRPFAEFAAAAGSRTLFQHPDLKLYGALLYSSDLAKTAAALKGKWKTHYLGKDEVLLVPTEHEGLAAVIREKPIEEWKRERLSSGEWLF